MWSTWPTTTRQTGTLGRWGRKAPRPVRAPLRATGGVAPYPHPPGGVPRPRGLVARSSWAGEAPALLLGLARRPLGTARHHSVTARHHSVTEIEIPPLHLLSPHFFGKKCHTVRRYVHPHREGGKPLRPKAHGNRRRPARRPEPP